MRNVRACVRAYLCASRKDVLFLKELQESKFTWTFLEQARNVFFNNSAIALDIFFKPVWHLQYSESDLQKPVRQLLKKPVKYTAI